MLTTGNFELRPRNAIVEFCGETLADLANLPLKDLDRSISNLHKSHSNIASIAHYVQLNATKFIILHALWMNFLDRIRCNDELEPKSITTLDVDDMKYMYQDCLEYVRLLALSEGLGAFF